VPIVAWLRLQARFAHLLRPENANVVERLQHQVDEDWAELVALCAPSRS
jgi:pyruvate ferredoxin oxidoreductase beta subunit